MIDIDFKPIVVNSKKDYSSYLSFIDIVSRYNKYPAEITYTYDNVGILRKISDNTTYTISRIQQSLDNLQQKIYCQQNHDFIINDNTYNLAKDMFKKLFDKNIVSKIRSQKSFCLYCNTFLEENEFSKMDTKNIIYKIKYDDNIYIHTQYPELIFDNEVLYHNSNIQQKVKNPLTNKNILLKYDPNINDFTMYFSNKQTISKTKRRQAIDKLEELKLIEKIINNFVCTCDYCGSKVEQNVDYQWTIDTTKLNNQINTDNIYPKEYRQKIEDEMINHNKQWCISSNLTYGLQVPIYFCPLCNIYTFENICDNNKLSYDNTVFLPSFLNLLSNTANILIAYDCKDINNYIVEKAMLYGDIYNQIIIYDNSKIYFNIQDTLTYLSKNINIKICTKLDYAATNIDIWILCELNKVIAKVIKYNNNYFLDKSLKKIQKFVTKKLCPKYLNFVKPNMKDINIQKTLSIVFYYLLKMTYVYEPSFINSIATKHNINIDYYFLELLVLNNYAPIHDIMNEVLREIKIKLISHKSNEFILDSDNKELLNYIKSNIGIIKNKTQKNIIYGKENMEQNIEYKSINMYDIIIYIESRKKPNSKPKIQKSGILNTKQISNSFTTKINKIDQYKDKYKETKKDIKDEVKRLNTMI